MCCEVLHRISNLILMQNLIFRCCELSIIKQPISIRNCDTLQCQASVAGYFTSVRNMSTYNMKCVC